MMRKYFKSKYLNRLKLQYFFIGIIITTFCAIILSAVSPVLLGSFDIAFYSPASSLILVLLTAYSTVNKRLFSIKAIFSRTVRTIFIATFLFMIVIVTRYFKVKFFDLENFSPLGLFIDYVTAILVTLFIEKVIMFVDEKSNRVFRTEILKLDQLIKDIEEELGRDLDFNLAKIKIEKMIEYSLDNVKVRFENIDKNLNNSAFLQEVADKNLRKFMHDNNMEYFGRMGDNLYMILYGHGKAFSKSEIETIETFVSKLNIVYERSKIYSQIKDFNNILEDEIKARTKQLQTAYDELKELDEAKTNFLSMASHQLRTPLSVARGYVSMLATGDFGELTEEQRKYVMKTEDNLVHLNRIVSEILDASRIEGNKFTTTLLEGNIVELVKNAYEQYKSRAEMKGLKYELILPCTDNNIKLKFDETKLAETIVNLIDNALNYTVSGSITVKLEDKPDSAAISVADTGIGIPKIKQNEIFKRFARMENAKRMRPDGSGLGLYLAKTVVDLHGGKIWFESEECKGSVFYIELKK